MTTIRQSNFASSRGNPESDTEWEECNLEINVNNLKVIVESAPVEFSLSGRDFHGSLPVGIHDFQGISVSKIYLRKTASTVQVFGFGV